MEEADTISEEADPPAAGAVVTLAPAKPARAAVRIAIGVALVAVVGLLLAVDSVWEAGFVYAAAGLAVVALAMGEFAELAARTGTPANRSVLVLGGAGLFLLHWAGMASPRYFPDPWLSASSLTALIAVGLLVSRVLRAQIEGALQSVAVSALGLLYVPLLLAFLTATRAEWGVAGVITMLAVAKGGSTGAYFVGKSLGRRKLAPTVSPRKTVAGAVGALVAGAALAYALSFSPWALMGGRTALAYGLVVAAAGIFGDLAASLLKRQAGLKDSGRLLPGHGGMLDMLDDVLFAAPVSYFFLLGAVPLG